MRSRSPGFAGLGGVLIAAVMLLPVPVAAEPIYTVRELRPPKGDVSAEATALNALGEVVGFSSSKSGIATALTPRRSCGRPRTRRACVPAEYSSERGRH